MKNAIFGGKKGRTKPIDEIEDETDLKQVAKKIETTKKPFDVKTNRSLDNGKIHVETLFACFDLYRKNMSNLYIHTDTPFNIQRRLKAHTDTLKAQFKAMGLDKYIDFTDV